MRLGLGVGGRLTRFRKYVDICVLAKDMPLPAFIQIEPTNRCNLGCATCTRTTTGQPLGNLTLTRFKKIVDAIPTLRRIQLSGLGEPFLCPELGDIVRFGVSKGIKFQTTTNGSIITNAQADLILSHFDSVTISLDSASEENYEKIRPGGHYKQLMGSMEGLIRARNERGSCTRIGLTFVATHLNDQEIPDYLMLGQKLKADHLALVEVENWLIPSQQGYPGMKRFVDQARLFSGEIRKQVKGYSGNVGLHFLSSRKRKEHCVWPFEGAFITYDGYVTPCCIRMDPGAFHFGNAYDTPFPELWNSRKYKQFRKSMLTAAPNRVCDRCPD